MARGRNTKTFSISTDLRQFDDLMRDFVKGAKDAAVPAAEAGAKVLYEATRNLTPVGKKGHWFSGGLKGGKGRYWFNAGNLKASIYMVLSKDNTFDGYATYHISWNYKKAPYAYMVHNGTSKAAAVPFVTMAYNLAAAAAQDAQITKYEEILTSRGLLS